METEKKIAMPVDSLSYSALTQLLRNPLIFKMKHILGVYDSKMSVSGMIGQGFHKAMEVYYGGSKNIAVPADKSEAQALARQIGLEYLSGFSDEAIDYGKTGSREDMLKSYTQALNFYFAEEPEYDEIIMVEEKMTAELRSKDGDVLPLPASGKPDIVERKANGEVHIIDFKVVSSFTDYETEDGIKIIQSQFMWHLLKAAKDINATKMVFREVKRSLNMRENAGKPQVRDWVVPFDHEPYFIMFYNIYRDAVKFISNPEAVYLPNLSDNFDGEHSWMIYAQGLISADMSDVEVMHKVRDVALVSKKFMPSRLDRAENKNLLPEEKIKIRLAEFGIPVEPVETKVGASVTQYRFKVSAGIRMSTIKKHTDDIALALEAKGHVNILAPIPGTNLVGVEVNNDVRTSESLTDKHLTPGTLMLPIGLDIHGNVVQVPLDEMPHLLVAGTTGSGKSVLLHNIINALTKQMTPEQMELVLIDPKRVELRQFAKLPHLRDKVLYEYEDALRAIYKLVQEMEQRYSLLEETEKRDIKEFNKGKRKNRMKYITVVIDEFADLILRSKTAEKKKKSPGYSTMKKDDLIELSEAREYEAEKAQFPWPSERARHNMSKHALTKLMRALDEEDIVNRADADVEVLIVRLAAMARAVGIHLVIATQRPSIDVITGLIKANFPTRIALTTSSPTDSIIILGKPGAETLSGKGDMIFMHPGRPDTRLQGFNL